MWNAKENTEKLECHQISKEEGLKAQVNDIEWSPNTSSSFASVANDGRIEIWDLYIDNLGPIVTHFDTNDAGERIKVPKTIVRFSASSPVLLTGNRNGEVDVYRCKGLEHVQVSDQDQQNRLLAAIKKDDFAEENKEKKEGDGDDE